MMPILLNSSLNKSIEGIFFISLVLYKVIKGNQKHFCMVSLYQKKQVEMERTQIKGGEGRIKGWGQMEWVYLVDKNTIPKGKKAPTHTMLLSPRNLEPTLHISLFYVQPLNIHWIQAYMYLWITCISSYCIPSQWICVAWICVIYTV